MHKVVIISCLKVILKQFRSISRFCLPTVSQYRLIFSNICLVFLAGVLLVTLRSTGSGSLALKSVNSISL